MPAVQRRGLELYGTANNATVYKSNVAQKDTIRHLTDLEPVFTPQTVMVNGKPTTQQVQTGTRFTNMPAEVRDKLFSDASAMRDVLSVTGNNPQVRSAMASELEAIYRREVYPDGEFKAGAAQAFNRKYSDHMELLFGSDNAAKITNVETMSAALRAQQANLRRVEQTFVDNFGGLFRKGDRIAPDHLVKEAMTSGSIDSTQLRNTMQVLDRVDPALATSMRAEMAQWLTDRAVSGAILRSGDSLRGLMNAHGAKIGAVMGAQYVKDMRKLVGALDIIDASKLARRVTDPTQGPYLQLTRTIFGALSSTQRRVTALNRFMRHRGARKGLEIMSDPEKLRQFIKLGELSPSQFASTAVIGNLGLRDLAGAAGYQIPEDEGTASPRWGNFRSYGESNEAQR